MKPTKRLKRKKKQDFSLRKNNERRMRKPRQIDLPRSKH
jgi:hypothetical protein